jgi:threonine/homoserine/homoserine lactone efflux protein
MLPSPPLLAAFVAASLILAVTPGPGVLYIVTRTLAQGRRAGLASVAGVALGNLANAGAAALGLAALFAVSSLAFTVVKFAGAAYLIWLGVRALRSPQAMSAAAPDVPAARAGRIFRDGVVVSLLNPKTTLFFAAFLPQFMSPGAAALPQSLLLSGLFVLIAAGTDSAYALAAGALAPRLPRLGAARSAGRYMCAAVYIGLGLLTAFGGGAQSRVRP